MVLVQKLGLLVLARQLEHSDSVHTVGHLDGRDLSKGSGYAFDMVLRDSCGVWGDTAGRKGESSTDKPRVHIGSCDSLENHSKDNVEVGTARIG